MPNQTPYETYLELFDANAQEARDLAAQRDRISRDLAKTDCEIEHRRDRIGFLGRDFLRLVGEADEVYRAVYEIDLAGTDIDKLTAERLRMQKTEQAAKQLMKLNNFLKEQTAETPVLLYREDAKTLTSNPGSYAYPTENEIVKETIVSLDASLLIVPPNTGLTVITRDAVYSPQQGSGELADSIRLPFTSMVSVMTRLRGFDYDLCLDTPYIRNTAEKGHVTIHPVNKSSEVVLPDTQTALKVGTQYTLVDETSVNLAVERINSLDQPYDTGAVKALNKQIAALMN